MKKIKLLVLLLFILTGCNSTSIKKEETKDLIIGNKEDTESKTDNDKIEPSKELFWGVKDNILYISATKTENATKLNYSTLYSSFDAIKSDGAVPWYPYPGREYPYKIRKVIIEKTDKSIVPTSMYSWFSNLRDCESIEGLENINTSFVTDMSELFNGCVNLQTINVSSFNTSNVKDMSRMFLDCKKISNLDLSSFDTSNVINMNNMFSHLCLKSLDLSNFDTSKVVNMIAMFSYSKIENLDLSSFDTSNVKNMGAMFTYSTIDKLDLSNFDTSNVTIMDCMFNWANINNLDISSFDTSNVKSIWAMFGSPNDYMKSIDISHFDLSKAEDIESISDLFVNTRP